MRLALLTIPILIGLISAQAAPPAETSTRQLEVRLAEINTRLEQLASLTLRSGVGPIGYRSFPIHDLTKSTWIEVDLLDEVAIDEVILVPVVWRDIKKGFLADGFPQSFRVLNEQGTLLAEISLDPARMDGIAPLIIPINGATASRIRIEVTRPSQRAFDQLHVFQLAELIILSGQTNVALRKPVFTPESRPEGGIGWGKRYLTDGTVPYLMYSGQGEPSLAYISPFDHYSSRPVASREPLYLSLDLKEPFTLDRIHLHAIDRDDTVPQAAPEDIGIPKYLRIEGANRPDFSDAYPLLDIHNQNTYDTSPIMKWNIPSEKKCRYIRLTAIEPYIYSKNGLSGPRIGFAEIEIFSNEINVAAGAPVDTNEPPLNANRKLEALTDGCNLYGRILPVREWMHQLAERQSLEHERPDILDELEYRSSRNKSVLQGMLWFSGLLLVATIIALLIQRNNRQRSVFQTRTRIAADLHDELGANLHAIGMLGDLIQKSRKSPERLDKLIHSIRAISRRTASATSYCVNMLEDEDRYADLPANMRRVGGRLTEGLEHKLSLEGESILQQLSPRKRIDIFLFYKECLSNIIRHSQASRITTRLTVNKRRLLLVVSDDGIGLNGNVPPSLKRRARLLRGQVASSTLSPKGSEIRLELSLKTRLLFLQR